MIKYILLILFLNSINLIILYKAKTIANIFSLNDKPIQKRSLHLKPVPKIGGLILFYNIIFINFYLIYANNIYSELNILILFSSVVFFIVGYLDDYFDLTAFKKFLLITLSIIIIYFFNNKILLNFLYFSILNKTFYLENISFIFTFFCIYLLINAFNMADGINGLSLSIFSTWIIFLTFYSKNFDTSFIYLFFPILIILLFFNLKNKIFIGNSGSHLLGGLVSIITIYLYNCEYLETSNEKNLYVENIFLLFLIPGIDCARLFFYRLFILKKSFYRADKNHLHHILIKNFNLSNSLLIYLSLILIPNFLFVIFKDYILILIFINILTYIFIIHRYFMLKNEK